MSNLIYIFLGVLLGLLSAWYDYGKRFNNHTPRFILRLSIVAIVSLINFSSVQLYLHNIVCMTAGFYIIFDYFLNILEGRKWNYIGDTAKSDIFIKKYIGWKKLLFFKLILIVLCNIKY